MYQHRRVEVPTVYCVQVHSACVWSDRSRDPDGVDSAQLCAHHAPTHHHGTPTTGDRAGSGIQYIAQLRAHHYLTHHHGTPTTGDRAGSGTVYK